MGDIDPAHLEALNAGTAPARTLTEALTSDQSLLLRAVVSEADDDLLAEADRAQTLGILKRMAHLGAALADRPEAVEVERLASHPSDTVRGRACFLIAVRRPLSLRAGLSGQLDQRRRQDPPRLGP
ncbi:hypothetical protein NSA19_09840 [Actinomyces bowdenii]|uniref:hypothetical protein n=1 Tax=Actinomyces bowdenii TaxID=131109 RepID=UPI00214BECDF|nr:hypothetical protein [Actinomyces bowdenii]MCR2053134.1 hypothetical protein [Actinomyces bowdenii]